jgi:hypothetical protein
MVLPLAFAIYRGPLDQRRGRGAIGQLAEATSNDVEYFGVRGRVFRLREFSQARALSEATQYFFVVSRRHFRDEPTVPISAHLHFPPLWQRERRGQIVGRCSLASSKNTW